MKIFKPSWLHHDGASILSVDWHPDGSKFATCGQGKQSGVIIIWKILDFLNIDYSSLKNAKEKYKIVELDDHLGCVNCVKWSPDGKLLASGGDDNVVMLWKPAIIKTVYSDPTSKDSHQESWRCAFTLVGHTADVLDIRWSPTGDFLASCSVDSNIIIWSRENFPYQIAVLKGHSGFVKGIAWDPIGEYLASQSDDNTLRVWAVSDLKQYCINPQNKKNVISSSVATIKRPFKRCTPTTQFLRLDWSPDGQFIICSHALNNGGPVAKIIERDAWSCARDLVGHRKAVTIVKFSPVVYESINDEIKIMCAIGSRDCGLSIWYFPYKRPLVVIHDLFSHPIMDISWSINGSHLAAVSWDGTVAFISLDDQDTFGFKRISSHSLNMIHKQLFGKSLLDSFNDNEDIIDDLDFYKSHLSTKVPSIENLQISSYLNSKIAPREASNTKIHSSEVCLDKPLPKAENGIVPMQTETVTKEGRRRIQPILIAQTMDEEELEDSRVEDLEKTSDIGPENISIPLLPKKRTQSAKIIPTKKFKQQLEESNENNLLIHLSSDHKPILEEPMIEDCIRISIKYNNSQATIIASNVAFCRDPDLFRLDVDLGNGHEWSIVLTSKVSLITTSDSIICFSTIDAGLHVYSIQGVELLPPLICHHPISGIRCISDKFVLVISLYGFINVWDIQECKNTIDQLDTHHLLKGLEIDSYKLLENGMPLIVTSDMNFYVYNLNLKSWLPAVSREFLSSNIQLSQIPSHSHVSNIQNLLNGHGRSLKGITRLTSSLQALCYQSFLENALHCSMFLGSSKEFSVLIKMFLRQLCHAGQIHKIRSFFDFILSGSSDSILKINLHFQQDLDRSLFISDLLTVVSENPKLQNLYGELKQLYLF